MAFDFSSLSGKYEQVLSIVGDDLKMIKTGRAKPSLVEDILVEAYGSRMPIKELGSISAPDPHMLIISIWDQSVLASVEKALTQAEFSVAVDGQGIRVTIPQLTGEKRQDMVKQVQQKIESGKQMLRNERTSCKKRVEGQKGDDGVSEDDIKAELEKLEEVTKEFIAKLEKLGGDKEQELLTI